VGRETLTQSVTIGYAGSQKTREYDMNTTDRMQPRFSWVTASRNMFHFKKEQRVK